MMTVEVLLFAGLRELAGRGSLRVRVPAGATPADIWARLPVGGPPPAGLRYAVGGAWADASFPLRDGDQVALITPVSGG